MTPRPPSPYDLLAATWPPARATRLGDWLAYEAPGAGRRVCSAQPLHDDWARLAAGLDAVEAHYAAAGLDALLQLPDGVGDAAALSARGYAVEAPTALRALDDPAAMAALAARPPRVETRPYLIDVEGPLAALDAVWAEGGIGPARRAVIARAEPIGRIIAARVAHRLAGAVFVGRQGAAAAVQALHVAESARRRGVGGDLMAAAARWALSAGATRLVWSVELDNAPARALYDGLGAGVVGGYRYFRRPA